MYTYPINAYLDPQHASEKRTNRAEGAGLRTFGPRWRVGFEGREGEGERHTRARAHTIARGRPVCPAYQARALSPSCITSSLFFVFIFGWVGLRGWQLGFPVHERRRSGLGAGHGQRGEDGRGRRGRPGVPALRASHHVPRAGRH